MSKAFIEDGQTLNGYIAGFSDLYGPVRFRYRPMTTVERSTFSRMYAKQRDSEKDDFIALKIRQHLVEWDLSRNGDGQPAPIKNDVLLKLQPRLFNRLFAIITGEEPSDEDPSQPDKDEQAAKEEAEATGVTVGEARERLQEGN